MPHERLKSTAANTALPKAAKCAAFGNACPMCMIGTSRHEAAPSVNSRMQIGHGVSVQWWVIRSNSCIRGGGKRSAGRVRRDDRTSGACCKTPHRAGQERRGPYQGTCSSFLAVEVVENFLDKFVTTCHVHPLLLLEHEFSLQPLHQFALHHEIPRHEPCTKVIKTFCHAVRTPCRPIHERMIRQLHEGMSEIAHLSNRATILRVPRLPALACPVRTHGFPRFAILNACNRAKSSSNFFFHAGTSARASCTTPPTSSTALSTSSSP